MKFWKRAAWWMVGGPIIGQAKEVWDKASRVLNPERPPTPQQESKYGWVLPLVYGKTRIGGSLIYSGSSSSGAFILRDGYKAVALCEGPIHSVLRTWKDKEVLNGLPPGFHLRVGSFTETATVGMVAADSLAYRGVACVYATNGWVIALGGTRQFGFEVGGLLYNTGGGDGDADPEQVIGDLLANAYHGLGWPTARLEASLGQDGSAGSGYGRYVDAAAFWISPAFTHQQPAREHIQRILDATNSEALWDGEKLRIVPLRDSALTANGYTFTPVTSPQYSFGEADIEGDVEMELEPLTDSYNVVPVEYLERTPTGQTTDPAYAYNAATVQSPYPVDLQRYGERRSPPIPLHMITRRTHAQAISRVLAQQSCLVRTQYKWRTGWRFCRLQPLDLVNITDPLLGIENVTVRISKVTHTGTGEIEIEADEWPLGLASAVLHDTQSSDGAIPVADLPPAREDGTNIPPGAITGDQLSPGQSNTDNLWPNPTSESAPPDGASAATLASAEYAGRHASAAYVGGFGRRITVAGPGVSVIEHEIPCAPGDSFVFEAWGRVADDGAAEDLPRKTVRLRWKTTAGATISDSVTTSVAGGWSAIVVSGAAPATAQKVALQLVAESLESGGCVVDFDSIAARKMIRGLDLVADSLRTSNYAEDGSGNPTAGAKLDHTGTSLKTKDLQVGDRYLSSIVVGHASVGIGPNDIDAIGFSDGISSVTVETLSGVDTLKVVFSAALKSGAMPVYAISFVAPSGYPGHAAQVLRELNASDQDVRLYQGGVKSFNVAFRKLTDGSFAGITTGFMNFQWVRIAVFARTF